MVTRVLLVAVLAFLLLSTTATAEEEWDDIELNELKKKKKSYQVEEIKMMTMTRIRINHLTRTSQIQLSSPEEMILSVLRQINPKMIKLF